MYKYKAGLQCWGGGQCSEGPEGAHHHCGGHGRSLTNRGSKQRWLISAELLSPTLQIFQLSLALLAMIRMEENGLWRDKEENVWSTALAASLKFKDFDLQKTIHFWCNLIHFIDYKDIIIRVGWNSNIKILKPQPADQI